MPSKVVVAAALPGRWREILDGHEVIAPAAGAWSRAEIVAQLGSAEALLPLLSVRIDEALLAAAPRLRVVANYAVGLDNVDFAAVARRRVLVTHTPDVLTAATAELTIALLLAAARRLGEAMVLLRAGGWHGWEPDQLLGLELEGARLGIVGLGRIGRAVAARARGFGMQVVYAARRPMDSELPRLPLDELLASSDAVSLHCPLNQATHHLIGARELALLKPGALLVNTARGAIIDEQALCAALDRGHLGGVGLDVFEHEPAVPAALLAHARVVALPHVGSATHAARARMAEMAAQSIADVLAGRRPAHAANFEVLDRPG